MSNLSQGSLRLDRRELLKNALAGTLALGFPSLLGGQAANTGVSRLPGKMIQILDGGGANVVAFPAADGLVLVDTGTPQSAGIRNIAAGTKVLTVFNTHFHLDQTGNNELFATAGAKIIAHE